MGVWRRNAWLGGWLIALVCTVCLAHAFAAEPSAELQVSVIYAQKNAGMGLDPRVRPYLAELIRQFTFASYRLESDTVKRTDLGKSAQFALPGEKILLLTPKSFEKDGRLKVHLSIPKLLETDLLFAKNGELFLGGPRHENGVLILIIHAR